MSTFVSRLVPSDPLVGVLGIGYPDSFYKVFIQTRGKWYAFSGSAYNLSSQRYVDSYITNPDVQTVLGEFSILNQFEVIDSRSLKALKSHVAM